MSEEKKQLVPRLRFEEFEYSKGLEQRKFSDLVTRVSFSVTDKNLPNVEYEDIVSARGKINKNIYQKENSKNGLLFKTKDILFGKLRPYLKNWLYADFDGIAVGDFWVFRANNSDSRYIYYLIQAPEFQRAANLSIGTKMPRSDWNIVSDSNFAIPQSLCEQEKIGSFFKTLDEMIQLQQSKVDKIKDIKSAYLSEMFPKEGEKYPKRRFEGFTEPWKEEYLGNLSNITTGALDANAMNPKGKYDFYTSGMQKYKIDTPAFEGPAITIAGNGATVGYMHLADGSFNAYQRTYVLTQFHAIREFLYLEIGRKLPVKIKQEARMGNIPYIVMDMLVDLTIHLPSLEEQQKIGEFFKNLDTQIAIEEEKLAKLEKLKQAYLNDMFV